MDRKDGVPLSTQLWDQWPSFAAYVVSFFIIGCIWISHHALFSVAAGVDRAVMVYNILLLLFVTAWRPGTANSPDELADLVSRALADFDLSATFV